MAGIGWYGPLIDLSSAPSHVDDFVQILVFVHRSNPVQYKLARGGNVVRTDIHVGDETLPFFAVSLWNKQLASSVSAGDVILLQNVKVTKFGSIVEARTVQYSSLLSLVHPYNSLLAKGVDELMGNCRVVGTAKDKLRRVIEWVQKTRSTLCNELKGGHQIPALRNWKVDEEQKPLQCYLLSEVLQLDSPGKAVFHASVGEIFLPSAWHDTERERMFISRRLTSSSKDCIVEDMICTGCQLCGSPLCSESTSAEEASDFHCRKSSNQLHNVGLIYRPFMLYVWDNSDYVPLLVRNKAAEILFGNIKAEKVHQSYKAQKADRTHKSLSNEPAKVHRSEVRKEVTVGAMGSGKSAKKPDFHAIWYMLLKMLLLQGNNSPFKFEAAVTPTFDMEDGRFEMIGMSMPCLKQSSISVTQEQELAQVATRP